MTEDIFQSRHIGPNQNEQQKMLRTIGAPSLSQLIAETVPESIRLSSPLRLGEPMSEFAFLESLRKIASRNIVCRSHIGLGYYDCIVPPVIQRNILENPGWYTQYTPYQAEIAQGRLEALLNFQTMVCDLTGMDIANASLLDEGTAAAEAMVMAHAIVSRRDGKSSSNLFFVSDQSCPQTIDVLYTRARPLGIDILVGSHQTVTVDDRCFGALLQYPGCYGAVLDYRSFVETMHAKGCLAVVATDLLSLALLTPPGEFNADVVVGSSQRFGVPMGYGGPHAAFFATRNDFVRSMPGRIIGVSVDAQGNPAYRMTLQTREQHIRREKATSNICTAQALLAIMAGMYAVYHGPNGIRRIATRVQAMAQSLNHQLTALGFKQKNTVYFDTLDIDAGSHVMRIREVAEREKRNFLYRGDNSIVVALDETTSVDDISEITAIFAEASGISRTSNGASLGTVPFGPPFKRESSFLSHPVFHDHHSETEMLRYIKSLETKDLSLTHSMIPLGSCTMKLNATSELFPVTWREFSNMHPFAPLEQTEGYRSIFRELEAELCAITGFDACSLQPNSGAQGEYAGLMVIRGYHHKRGDKGRDIILIPASAHGTNPASAVMAGYKVVVVRSDENGNIDVGDLKRLAEQHSNDLAALMVTYPSTHGIFEESIKEICAIIHRHGGQVYMDGANLNAQVGITSPATIGADVCHINLHKTFSIPHGGGGPGMGPICVAKHLAPYLPGHVLVKTSGEKAIGAVSSAPWGSGSILLISYGYIKMLGTKGATEATHVAILNANYLKERLAKHYPILYVGANGRCAHEFILDLRLFKSAGIEAEDVAKRLMDYGFHAPTVSFPVPGTLMIEPTESEPKCELDRFADSMIAIRAEIQEVIDGKADRSDNVLKNAPHTAPEALSDDWHHSYSRKKAVYPLPFVQRNKFWPSVARINNLYGDKNIMCVCPPIESYMEQEVTSR